MGVVSSCSAPLMQDCQISRAGLPFPGSVDDCSAVFPMEVTQKIREVKVFRENDAVAIVQFDLTQTVLSLKEELYNRHGIPVPLQQLSMCCAGAVGEILQNSMCLLPFSDEIEEGEAGLFLETLPGPFVLSAGKEDCLMWDLSKRPSAPSHRLEHESRDVRCIAVDWPARRLLTGDIVLRLWDLNTGVVLQRMSNTSKYQDYRDTPAISCVSLHCKTSRCMSADEKGTLRIWDFIRGVVLYNLQTNNSNVLCLDVHWPSCRLMMGSRNGTLHLYQWDAQQHMNFVCRFVGHESWVQSLAVNWVIGKALTGSADCNIILWNTEDERQLQKLVGHKSVVQSLEVSWDEERLVSCDLEGRILLWSVPVSGAPSQEGDDFVLSPLRELKVQGEPAITTMSCLTVDWPRGRIMCADYAGIFCFINLDPEVSTCPRPLDVRGHTHGVRFLLADWRSHFLGCHV
eukprot:TRINITY_DN21480_c0_g1_i1.p1 TRINITY_DN21480_c0_g1~~TRINITY_DN21480_c0_g1_i1.p1  ORF type:complete len:457 (-),score=44.82 TRINITY_DN21480_c0_g1_i1:29-1399(-)